MTGPAAGPDGEPVAGPDLDGVARRALALIRDVPDHPVPGVVFKDITPLLADADAFAQVCDALAAPFATGAGVDVVVGLEARGFILGAPVALALGAGFVPVRKRGKLPYRTVGTSYRLEYGTAEVELHADGVRPGQRVLVVDDVLATGGTAAAACELVERIGGVVVGVRLLMELTFLGGRAHLPGRDVTALLTV